MTSGPYSGEALNVDLRTPILEYALQSALPARAYDAIVVGAGVAGLTFALQLPENRRVALITKGELGESNTRYAQGGLSAAISPEDSPRFHEQDTLVAGAGLSDPDAVRTLVDGAPEAVDWLISIGANFDRDAGGAVLLGREAAHSHRRVLHAGGDATGAEIERALVAEARRRTNIDFWPHSFAIDLVQEGSRVTGLLIEDQNGLIKRLEAPVTVIAAGGAGQVWATTSNPLGATADGLAMAIRAGAVIADCEFVQFHPTVLSLESSTAFLVSEAVRGEGAVLRNDAGTRFMLDEHPQAELAPRDVVARGIHRQLIRNPDGNVYLDLRSLDPGAVVERFPTISRELQKRGLDLAHDLIPVAPAAHYFMGGLAASSEGRTSLEGLLALGEASCTGVHGANRLASNSLLEGLVFGALSAGRVARDYAPIASEHEHSTRGIATSHGDESLAIALREAVQETMSENVGVERDAAGLSKAIDMLRQFANQAEELPLTRSGLESRNLLTSATAIATAALYRCESRGAQFRSDFPTIDPALDGHHSLQDPADRHWRYGSLAEAWEGAPLGSRIG